MSIVVRVLEVGSCVRKQEREQERVAEIISDRGC